MKEHDPPNSLRSRSLAASLQPAYENRLSKSQASRDHEIVDLALDKLLHQVTTGKLSGENVHGFSPSQQARWFSNLITYLQKDQSKRERRKVRLQADVALRQNHSPYHDQVVINEVIAEILRAWLKSLDADFIIQNKLEGVSVREIAERTQQTARVVGYSIEKAREKLGKQAEDLISFATHYFENKKIPWDTLNGAIDRIVEIARKA